MTHIAELRAEAERGCVRAQYALGLRYYHGAGVEEDETAAAEWFRKAAAHGSAKAQCMLGEICDGAEAVRWTRKAAKQGLPEAQYRLGVMYCGGEDVRRDYLEAARWYGEAAEQGHAESQHALGDMYYGGWGVQQDYGRAAEWFRKAAEQGDESAQYDLVHMFTTGLVVPRDASEAKKWCWAADSVPQSCPHCRGRVHPSLLGTCPTCGERIGPPDTRTAEERYQVVLERKKKASREFVVHAILTVLLAVGIGSKLYRVWPGLAVMAAVLGLILLVVEFVYRETVVSGCARAVARDPEVDALRRREGWGERHRGDPFGYDRN